MSFFLKSDLLVAKLLPLNRVTQTLLLESLAYKYLISKY
jgi:hypothetical protein